MVANLTERQQKWFASVQASLERDTGKTLAEWVEIVRRDCPETTTGKQSAWLKANHGLGVNRAAQILDALNPAGLWDDPDTLRAALWKDAQSAAILQAIEALISQISDVVPTQRKGYSAWSRKVQFAALKPVRGGQALLGLALSPQTYPRLEACGKESWSERLKSKITLTGPDVADDNLLTLLRQAADKS
ncbi:hypothetical protein ABAC460_04695 [Asticcacaulis sp. AC460]|uniref:DUF4287 domain-containing protein n=1 Tax=Asticcacaulis sp. AC460 TaxID=1282360 RepID=UPI0003C3BC2D|nr:DUF4287 domain-containing protein [Asticcacaulis sp. AC460]ESQ92191.1 hypothetical protein ABAC460_04695 [Asticcacaulis sp. AC460]